MKRQTIITAVLSISIIFLTGAQAKSKDNKGAPTISVTKLDINDKSLQLNYEIRNDTENDLWTFEGAGGYDIGAEVFMEKDNQTLLIRSRLDIPAYPDTETPSFDGRYIHLKPGRSLYESVSLPIPARPCYGFGGWSIDKGLPYAKCLAFELGYYVGDPREIIRSRLIKEKISEQKISSTYPHDPNKLINYFAGKGVLIFNEMNEKLRSRDEEVLIPYTDRLLKGERSLRVTLNDLHIPYMKQDNSSTRQAPPKLTSCTKVEIQYKPSMLEYFFPDDNQQNLFSPEEKHYLITTRKIILEDRDNIKTIINDIKNIIPMSYFVIRKRTTANVICYDGSEPLMSFSIYNNVHCLIGHDINIFEVSKGFKSLKVVTPFINKMQLRSDCAANLKNIWHRFQLYSEAEKNRTKTSSDNSEIIYPPLVNWCDAIMLAYKSIGQLDYWIRKPLICPTMNKEDKCYYALNPNCKPNSPPDMVLLFETKAGWNQHGGPELFTFDNHDPKGGCVLLNDGTVKFIRTTEELQQLRWK